MPNVYVMGLQWLDNVEVDEGLYGRIPGESSKSDIERVLNLITSSLDLNSFY